MKNLDGWLIYGVAVLAIVVLLTAIFGLSYVRYKECRAHGFSVFYCISGR